jgi:hypothetical protein
MTFHCNEAQQQLCVLYDAHRRPTRTYVPEYVTTGDGEGGLHTGVRCQQTRPRRLAVTVEGIPQLSTGACECVRILTLALSEWPRGT